MNRRKKIVAGNWKMNLNSQQVLKLMQALNRSEQEFDCDVIVFPSFVYLVDVIDFANGGGRISVGAQNCAATENGAYTGEVSVAQLADIGVEYVLIGHSERRIYYNENHSFIADKLKCSLANNLRPVFCCGEPQIVREAGEQLTYVKQQLVESLFTLKTEEIGQVIVAYEPVWAIGTGLNASAEQAQEMHTFIRHQIAEHYSLAIANEIQILYGGSCKPGNAAELFACHDVDGGLIGGASLIAEDFLNIISLAH